MPDAEPIDRLFLFSIARLASEMGMGRDTVAKRLQAANVAPAGFRSGHAVYRLRDAMPALIDARPIDEAGFIDPSRMKPTERRAWYQSENERMKFELDLGQLIPASEVQSEMAALAKIVVRMLETLPDTAERDLRCGAETVEYLQRKVREVRTEIANRVAADEGEDVRERA